MSEVVVRVENEPNEGDQPLGIELASPADTTQPAIPSPKPGNPSPMRGPSGSAYNPERSFMKSLSSHRTVRISLRWENINLSVVTKNAAQSKFLRPVYKQKKILRNISGHAKSGELLAIMGPTGTNHSQKHSKQHFTHLPQHSHTYTNPNIFFHAI